MYLVYPDPSYMPTNNGCGLPSLFYMAHRSRCNTMKDKAPNTVAQIITLDFIQLAIGFHIEETLIKALRQ
jgi:hypothetical protein